MTVDLTPTKARLGELLEVFEQLCDGDREHSEAVHITNLDNPGWSIRFSRHWMPGLEAFLVCGQRTEGAAWWDVFVRDEHIEGVCGNGGLPHLTTTLLEAIKLWNAGGGPLDLQDS